MLIQSPFAGIYGISRPAKTSAGKHLRSKQCQHQITFVDAILGYLWAGRPRQVLAELTCSGLILGYNTVVIGSEVGASDLILPPT